MAINSAHLLDIARGLSSSHYRRPRQSDLRRAISTIYYALFHVACKNCADSFVGRRGPGNKAWRQVYRSIHHGNAKERYSRKDTNLFPQPIINFANEFIQLQAKRHEADYDPQAKFTRSEVLNYLSTAEVAIDEFYTIDVQDRKAFAVWTLFGKRA